MPDRTDPTGETRTTDEQANVQTVLDLCAAFNDRDRERFDAAYAEEVVVNTPGNDRTMDHAAHWTEAEGAFASFPDIEAEIHSIAADGDRVFYRATYAGTFAGAADDEEDDLQLDEAAGTYVEWDHWSEYRFEDGVIVEAWQLSDTYHLHATLGLLEETAA